MSFARSGAKSERKNQFSLFLVAITCCNPATWFWRLPYLTLWVRARWRRAFVTATSLQLPPPEDRREWIRRGKHPAFRDQHQLPWRARSELVAISVCFGAAFFSPFPLSWIKNILFFAPAEGEFLNFLFCMMWHLPRAVEGVEMRLLIG